MLIFCGAYPTTYPTFTKGGCYYSTSIRLRNGRALLSQVKDLVVEPKEETKHHNQYDVQRTYSADALSNCSQHLTPQTWLNASRFSFTHRQPALL